MKRLALAILVVTAVAAAVLLALDRPGAEASPDVFIFVDSTADTNTRDSKLTLREAMLLATGDLEVDALYHGECVRVLGAIWLPYPILSCSSLEPPGAASADTIVFDTTDFPPGSPATITLSYPLPPLTKGDDTVDGTAAGVVVDGADKVDYCFGIASDDNVIKGLEIYNCDIGVLIEYGQGNIIGGSTEPERNVISANNLYGVKMTGISTEGNVVKGNYIGTNAAGDAAKSNKVGVAISDGAHGNIIGGSAPGEGNVISGNDWKGVFMYASGTDGNVVRGNYIGTDASGTAAIPNVIGVAFHSDASNNTIGGTAVGEGNVVAFSTYEGVELIGPATTGNTIRGNSIHSNGTKGIDNEAGGNTELPPPTITGFGSLMGTACPGCLIDVYSDQADEGEVYEGSTAGDYAGNWTFPGTPQGPNVTATATDWNGNTSEFSDAVAVPEPTPTPSSTPTATPSPTPSPTPETTRTVVWGPGWHNATWSGASTPEEVFACAAGNYAAAYRLVSGGWERHFPDRPDLSNMTDLGQYDAFLVLLTEEVTCDMPVASPSGTERTLDWGVGWQNDGWTGTDGTAPQDAFACAASSYAAAYRLVSGGWERYFPDRPEISNMGPLNSFDPFLILVTAPVSCTMPIAP